MMKVVLFAGLQILPVHIPSNTPIEYKAIHVQNNVIFNTVTWEPEPFMNKNVTLTDPEAVQVIYSKWGGQESLVTGR